MHVCTSTYHITLLDPPAQVVCSYIVKFIQVHFMACNYNYLFFFFFGQWKLINMCHYCDYVTITHLGFPNGSDSKESTCNVGDLDSIPG